MLLYQGSIVLGGRVPEAVNQGDGSGLGLCEICVKTLKRKAGPSDDPKEQHLAEHSPGRGEPQAEVRAVSLCDHGTKTPEQV